MAVLIITLVLVSCSSTDYADEEFRPVSNKPVLDVLASDTIYQFYNLDKSLSVIDVSSIDDYEDLEDNIVIVNASSIDIDELSMASVGIKNNSAHGDSASMILLDVFKDIKANSKKKFSLDNLELCSFKYLVFNVEKPVDADVRITFVEERHDDLIIYFTDI